MLISRNNQSFTSYSAENFCENLNLAAESPKQMAQTQTVLFECDNQNNWSYESVLDEVQINGLSQRLVSATWYPLQIVLLNSF